MQLQILKEINSRDWNQIFSEELQLETTLALENGRIILFPQLNFMLMPQENKFLSTGYSSGRAKNISFNYANDSLNGAKCAGKEREELINMLRRFKQSSYALIQKIFPSYTTTLQVGRTSFRPIEVAGRTASCHKDDTKLHVDAFPATPNQGRRILRVFSNVNPFGQNRFWRVGEPFAQVAERFFPDIADPWFAKSTLLKMLKLTKSYRTAYDHIMLQIHNRMKENFDYQKNVSQNEIQFAPGSTWIVQTDHVSHAAMAGQYVLEQTFYLPVQSMLKPELSPLRILEKLSGKMLAHS